VVELKIRILCMNWQEVLASYMAQRTLDIGKILQ
jgi:hypothetical protein